MPNLTNNASFTALVAATETMVAVLANAGIPDAEMLMLRQAGWNNLQGHVRGLIPLAAWFIRHEPSHLQVLHARTNLNSNMSSISSEARGSVWDAVARDLRHLLSTRGGDVITVATNSSTPTTAARIARTYLSTQYGGGQNRGGAGNTVFKRTLKLMAHALPN